MQQRLLMLRHRLLPSTACHQQQQHCVLVCLQLLHPQCRGSLLGLDLHLLLLLLPQSVPRVVL